ncbi:MAG TPA: alpha/beta hydrolase [Verrucomicrobiae bacterium]|nr:alpha/beta hydrolase [Verrucomicrobiae bacterium]
MKRTTRSRWRLILFLLVVGGAYLGLRTYDQRVVFNPSTTLTKTPQDIDLPFDTAVLTASDGVTIYGWFIPQHPRADVAPAEPTSPTLLFLHDGDGNISDRLEKIHLFHDIGLAVFIIDYRGYGKSGGAPGERGLSEDALAAYSYLVDQRDVKPAQLYIYGEGLGAAVAIGLATKARAAGLITEGATASVLENVRQDWPLIPWQYLLHNRFDSLSKIGSVRMPVLLIHSDDDDAASFNDSRRLFALAHQPKELVEIHGSHKDAFVNSFDTYYDAISRFVHGPTRPAPDQPKPGTDATSSSTPGDAPASKEPTS